MIKRSFFSLAGPKLTYPILTARPVAPVEIPIPERAQVILNRYFTGPMGLRIGDNVRTGQRIEFKGEDQGYFVSPVTGSVTGISAANGYMGKNLTAISIRVAAQDVWDEEFRLSEQLPEEERAARFLYSLPGQPDFGFIAGLRGSLKTIVVCGPDKDLLVSTGAYVVKNRMDELKKGFAILRKLFDKSRILFVLPEEQRIEGAVDGIEVKGLPAIYPQFFPALIMKKVLGIELPTGVSCDEMGVGFISAEAVAELGNAFSLGRVPVDKIVTVIKKDCSIVHVKARIGTPVKDLLDTLKIETGKGDRLIAGGPMAGITLDSADAPVTADTDAVMVQDAGQAPVISDNHCVNCGECVRVCPANVPVNMLIRVLENRLYDEAVRAYDLLSCIECGLCTYVCTAAIPIFHYVMLGKYEYDRARSAEVQNA